MELDVTMFRLHDGIIELMTLKNGPLETINCTICYLNDRIFFLNEFHLDLICLVFLVFFYHFSGLWNVPFISSCYLVKKEIFSQITYADDELDADMAFCKAMRKQVLTFLLTPARSTINL